MQELKNLNFSKVSTKQPQEPKKIIKTYKDLIVYILSYNLAMEIFQITKKFPKEETFSLIDQIRRSSRSIPVNICEGWAKRRYENLFLKFLNDSCGSCEETKVWLDFAKDCQYITQGDHENLIKKYNEVGAMLYALARNWKTF